MSIDAKEFDKHSHPLKYIYQFLSKNSDRAFSAAYIAKKVGLNKREVEIALMWESLANILDRTYRTKIEIAVIEGITYYKYKSA